MDAEKAQDVVRTIYQQDTFSFSYDNININFSNLEYNVNGFKSGAIVVVEFQIMLHNFKVYKKIDIVKAYLFQLFC